MRIKVSIKINSLNFKILTQLFDIGQEREKFIPFSEDMVFLKYNDKDEGKIAYLFFYPSENHTWIIESDDSVQAQVDSMNLFENLICSMLFAQHNNKSLKDCTPEDIAKYCNTVSMETIFNSQNLNELIQKPGQQKFEEEK